MKKNRDKTISTVVVLVIAVLVIGALIEVTVYRIWITQLSQPSHQPSQPPRQPSQPSHQTLVVNAGNDQYGDTGQKIYFNGTAEAQDGFIVEYAWDFDGDGYFDWFSDSSGITIHHYNKSGNYSAIFRATDNRGQSAIDICNIKITDRFQFTISMNKTKYIIHEPIWISARLKNIGNESRNVSEMGLGLGPPSLDFEIITPEGFLIWLRKPFALTMPFGFPLRPGEEYNSPQNITNPFWCFGNERIEKYNFTTLGKYTVRGVYRSDPSRCLDNTVWDGILYSEQITFWVED